MKRRHLPRQRVVPPEVVLGGRYEALQCQQCGDTIWGVDRPWCVACSPYVKKLLKELEERGE